MAQSGQDKPSWPFKRNSVDPLDGLQHPSIISWPHQARHRLACASAVSRLSGQKATQFIGTHSLRRGGLPQLESKSSIVYRTRGDSEKTSHILNRAKP